MTAFHKYGRLFQRATRCLTALTPLPRLARKQFDQLLRNCVCFWLRFPLIFWRKQRSDIRKEFRVATRSNMLLGTSSNFLSDPEAGPVSPQQKIRHFLPRTHLDGAAGLQNILFHIR